MKREKRAALRGGAKNAAKNHLWQSKIAWQDLKKDDIIQVKQASGPVFDGVEPISMGYSGKFKVKQIMKDGFGAFPIDKRSPYSGFCFIYMGEPVTSPETGIHRRPHIIRKIIENKG